MQRDEGWECFSFFANWQCWKKLWCSCSTYNPWPAETTCGYYERKEELLLYIVFIILANWINYVQEGPRTFRVQKLVEKLKIQHIQVEDPGVCPPAFTLLWTTQMVPLFTVVLSAWPSGISESHNPLFITSEAHGVCKWTWVMADKGKLTGPTHSIQPHHFSRRSEQSQTHAQQTYIHKLKQWRKKESKLEGCVLFFGDMTSLFLYSPSFFMSCHLVKKSLWSFQVSWLSAVR